MEITWKFLKLGFLGTVKLKNTFSKSLNTFQHWSFAYSSVIKPVNIKVSKTFPKRILIRKKETKLDFCIKKYFFPNKRKNLSPFRNDVPIRSHALCTLGAGATRDREIIKPVRTLLLVLAKLVVDKNLQSKQSTFNCRQSILIKFGFCHLF